MGFCPAFVVLGPTFEGIGGFILLVILAPPLAFFATRSLHHLTGPQRSPWWSALAVVLGLHLSFPLVFGIRDLDVVSILFGAPVLISASWAALSSSGP